VCGLLVALNLSADNALALALEAEAERLATRTFVLLIDHILSSGFFFGVCVWVTAKEWQEVIRNARGWSKQEGRKFLDAEIFAKWNGMMGRKPHSERLGTPWQKEVDDAVRQFMATKVGTPR
jgi:hypothetical protein